jgi:hypothetical protein
MSSFANILYSQLGKEQSYKEKGALMSGFGSFDDATPTTFQPPAKGKRGKSVNGYQKPPYGLLGIGFILAPLSALLLLVAPPTGSNTILLGLLFWVIGLASYFAPFALFTLSDLEKQASLTYLRDPKKSASLRRLLLLVGSICLLFPTFYLANSLASWVSVILG